VHQRSQPFRILDPAVGEGELLASLLKQISDRVPVEVFGFDTNEKALELTTARLRSLFPSASIHLRVGDFLKFVSDMPGSGDGVGLFEASVTETFDLIIANPPYVRTQIMGAEHAQLLAKTFGLNGRVDLYYAFLVGIAMVLRPDGIAGIIVSNRFMTTKAGTSVRRAILDRFNVRHVWDLGDTKLFDAAVLPAVLIVEGRNGQARRDVSFTSIYETLEAPSHHRQSVIDALSEPGIVEVPDGRRFRVRCGNLNLTRGPSAVWRVATKDADAWLETVAAHTWRKFRGIGKIRVGVKTCADKVFIRTDWNKLGEQGRPELLKSLTTHHIARRFKPNELKERWEILYPHETVGRHRRAVELDKYPRSDAYLRRHRAVLANRTYVLQAGRKWYEIWVPQDPAAWEKPKLVFRDIAKEPCFWIDFEGSVVNGDCYWMVVDDEELLWLAAAVANSTFIEAFYDHRFNNKLYAGRRRFMTQYVEEFPLPTRESKLTKEIIAKAMAVYAAVGTTANEALSAELNRMVWTAFGLRVEEVAR